MRNKFDHLSFYLGLTKLEGQEKVEENKTILKIFL